MATEKRKTRAAAPRRAATKSKCSACGRRRAVGRCEYNADHPTLGNHCRACCDSAPTWKAK